MNRNKISKILILITIFMLMVCASTTVFAEEPPMLDFSGDFETTPTPTPTPTPTVTPEGEPTPTPTVTPENDIPYAGTEDTILMIVAFVTCGIVGIYTFIKLSEYSNI